MKLIKHLRASWLIAAMAGAVAVGEFVAWHVCRAFEWRFPSAAIAAVCIGLVAAFVAWQYDGVD